MRAWLVVVLGFQVGCQFVQQGQGSSAGSAQSGKPRGAEYSSADLIAMGQGKKLCNELAAILDQVKATREARRATPLYRQYLDLLPKLDAPETAGPEVLTQARSLRDDYVKQCMQIDGWGFDACRRSDPIEPLNERIVKVAIAQKNYALAFAETAFMGLPDQLASSFDSGTSLGSEFLHQVHLEVKKNPRLLFRKEMCRRDNIWRMPDTGPQHDLFNPLADILTAAGLDPKTGYDKMYTEGLIKSVGTGTTATITFAPIPRAGSYKDNCHWTTDDTGEPVQRCQEHATLAEQAAAPSIKLTEGEAAGLKPGYHIIAGVDPKTRVGYLISARAATELLNTSGGNLVRLRAFTF